MRPFFRQWSVMRTVARWILLVIATVFVGALVEPFFVRLLNDLGWYADPGTSVGNAVNFISRIIGETAFHWTAGIVFGLVAGMWIDALLKRLDRAKNETLRALGREEATPLLDEFSKRHRHIMYEHLSKDPAVQFSSLEDMEGLHARTMTMMVSLYKLGVETPILPQPRTDPLGFMVDSLKYIQYVQPLMVAGHIKELRQISKLLSLPTATLAATGMPPSTPLPGNTATERQQ
jgi:hypothetical protein